MSSEHSLRPLAHCVMGATRRGASPMSKTNSRDPPKRETAVGPYWNAAELAAESAADSGQEVRPGFPPAPRYFFTMSTSLLAPAQVNKGAKLSTRPRSSKSSNSPAKIGV